MNHVATLAARPPAPAGMSEAEWHTRIDLAAAYRLAALYEWTDLTSTHFSARIPGTPDHFLLNPFGLLFDEITASSLVKVDSEGRILDDTEYRVNRAGFTIHSAVHMALPEMHGVLHTHTTAGNGVAMQKEGLLPLSQRALTILPFVRYHDYEGVALDLDERERLVNDLDDGRILVLRNHGLLTVGESIGAAFVWMYRIETACRFQVAGLAGGRELATLSDNAAGHTMEQGRRLFSGDGGLKPGFEWPALLRQLERRDGIGYLQ